MVDVPAGTVTVCEICHIFVDARDLRRLLNNVVTQISMFEGRYSSNNRISSITRANTRAFAKGLLPALTGENEHLSNRCYDSSPSAVWN